MLFRQVWEYFTVGDIKYEQGPTTFDTATVNGLNIAQTQIGIQYDV